jgi:hypothetical protein
LQIKKKKSLLFFRISVCVEYCAEERELLHTFEELLRELP